MNLYLTIITTVLVMTQIIRVTQNAMQLKHLGKVNQYDDYIKKVYEKIEIAVDNYLYEKACGNCKYVDYATDQEPCKRCKHCYINHINIVSRFEERE